MGMDDRALQETPQSLNVNQTGIQTSTMAMGQRYGRSGTATGRRLLVLGVSLCLRHHMSHQLFRVQMGNVRGCLALRHIALSVLSEPVALDGHATAAWRLEHRPHDFSGVASGALGVIGDGLCNDGWAVVRGQKPLAACDEGEQTQWQI